MNELKNHLDISKEVAEALQNNRPVVALESTIISHGMPYPKNVETALAVEAVVRSEGAVPATLAVIDGRLRAGLSPQEIETFGKKGLEITKASRRDLPILCSRKQDGATTVSATMIIAQLSGIAVFATGGIGGVHRGAETTMDISADLEELSMTETVVVCAGAKSILDLGLTLEYLETKGVPVIGFGTEELPAFFSRESGFRVDYRMDTPAEIAAAFNAKKALGLRGGMLVANPIPQQYSMDISVINQAISQALTEANLKGVKGKDVTPFLLDRIQHVTDGGSLAANIELVYNNARLASRIAAELCEIS